jgi:hypothetical protein
VSWAKRLSLFACLGLFFGLVAVLSVPAAPVNLLFFPLTNAPGISTTVFPSSTSLGGVGVNLNAYNATGAAKDFEGAAGSGVNGMVNGVAAMCLTNGDGGTQPGNATGTPLGASANASNSGADKGDPLLGFGSIHDFVVTMWFNQPVKAQSGSGLVLPRLFVLSTGSGSGQNDGTANSIGVKFQQENEFIFSLNTTTLTTTYASDFTTNKWYFVAWVYDNTNLYQFTGSDTTAATLQNQFAAPGLVVNLANPSTLIIGNRNWEGSRGFDGWMEDFRLYTNVASAGNNASLVENIRQAIAPKIPTVSGAYPDGTSLEQATNTFTFTAKSSDGFGLTNIDLKINSVDVSSGCTFVTNGTGSTNVTVKYTGLPQQTIVTAVMTAVDAIGLAGSGSVTFDTFNPTNFIVKAEEFDFGGGQFIDNPDYTDGNPADANSYYGLNSVEEVDTHKGPSVGDNQATDYRYDDGTGTQTQTPLAAGELPLPRIVNAPLDGGGNPQANHMITDWSSGEWQNYTKTFPAGNYNVWARLSTSSGSTVNFDQVTSGQETPSQTTTRLGQFTFSGTGGFQWVELMQNGSPAVVNLAGQNTVRATTGGGAAADLYMLVAANPGLPTISNVNPNGAFLFQYPSGGKLTFTASSPSTTINTANIVVTLNGNNVSSLVTYTGGPSTWQGTYSGLLPNQTYAITIQVMDANGGTANAQLNIDTWQPVLQFEAEDFDFDPALSPVSAGNGLRFIDNPIQTSVPTTLGTYAVTATNSYEGQTGDAGIDEFGTGAGTRPYRPGNVATAVVVDTPRAQFAHNQDFNIGFLGAGFWEDYTRTWPAGTYNLYARMASGASSSGLPTPPGIRNDVDLVVAGDGTTKEVVSYLGTFNIPTTNGYSSYSYYPLIDRFGNYAQLNLSGPETLRSMLDLTTTAGLAQFGLNVNFYMLTAPRTDLPRIDAVYPDGTSLMQQTNTFSFVASNPTYGVSTNNIRVTLNGVNLTNLVFTGSSSSWTISYPGLQPNSSYTAVITITDNNNQVHTATVNFDTFSANNFTWEAEDFDFDPANSPDPSGNSLRFIDSPAPTSAPATNSYYGQTGDLDIDYSSQFINLNVLPVPAVYRSAQMNIDNVIPIEATGDTTRQRTTNAQLTQVDPTILDYDIFNLTNTAWINYTRTFPTGNFYVYARLSAGTTNPIIFQFAQVTNGVGTSTQASNVLGYFQATGNNYTTWQYAPLINTNTGLPVVLRLGGVATFQVIGDGAEHVNFFMLAPVPPNSVAITPTVSGSTIHLSFPTQVGYTYTMYYKNNLSDPTWLPVVGGGNPVSGSGAVQSVTDSMGTSHRFYQLTIQ